ncbi:MAG: hypothetical protein HUN04_21060 [Desulfobacter sp.]|nr:MAG: hypothetical protein HUN04_21060 [Desulfobacter sp.]
MILHDFIYEWDGKSRSGKAPITWWPGAYRVKIVKLADDTKGIRYLFPTAVFLKGVKTKAVMNTSLKNYIHNFAEKISEKYGLDAQKTIWVEVGDKIRVAHLKPDGHLTDKTFFSFTWREARPNELEEFAPYLDDMRAPPDDSE